MLKRINKSLYLKIIIVLGLNYFIFYSLTFNTQRWFFQKRHFQKIQRSATNFANLLIDKIEPMESYDEIKNKLYEINISLKITDGENSYKFPSNMRELNFEGIDNYNEYSKVGFDEGLIVQIVRNGKIYEIILESKDGTINYFLFINRLLSFVYFLIMAIIIYYSLRLLLNPLNKLHKNVKELSIETLDKPVNTNRTDELGELINSFNEMKKVIMNMIQSREQLLLDVSHELRTPLTRTNLSLEMMNDCEEKSDIQSDIREMETMVSELLESAKIQSKYGELNFEKVNIIDLIDDVALYFENDNPGIKMIDLPEKVELDVDIERIKIVLKNILSNAIKYSNDDSKSVEICTEIDDEFFTMKIKNFGEGIPGKDLDFIFEPFYRVDKSRNKKTGGYGLGMHLVQKIITAHHGIVSIDSKFGEWAEVQVKLPL